MIDVVSQSVILVLAAGISMASIWGIVKPVSLMKLVSGVVNRDWGIHFAVVVRLLFGAALIIAAAGSRFPPVFLFLGCLMILAALIIMIVGRKRLHRLMAWLDRLSLAVIRIMLVFGIMFGGFLIYAIV